ncbi:MAG: ABC transporter permease [Bacteroidetes bacterium]|nr:ABC transporter permease [Bacteroidota bacterium]
MFYRKEKYNASASLSSIALKRFLKNKLSLCSLIIIALFTLIAILGYLITPDQTPFSNEQYLELTTKKPGYSIQMLRIKKNEKEEKTNFFSKMLYGERSSYLSIPVYQYKFEKDYIEVEIYSGTEPNDGEVKKINLANVVFPLDNSRAVIQKDSLLQFHDVYGKLHNESIASLRNTIINENFYTKHFWLGSDRYGRDVLSQLIIGTRVSLSVGFISVIISLIIGILLGALAGFFKGWVDSLIVWFINVIWSIPTLLLVIAITFALGKGFWQVFIAVGLTMWVEVARVVRGQILSIREKEFVEAGRALGFRNGRIIFRHILPNVMSAVIVISAANFASAILMEAGLSFLGIGVQPPMPSWGSMIKENYGYIILDAAYLAVLPGVAIMIVVLAFMIIGNGLRDALDVKFTEK